MLCKDLATSKAKGRAALIDIVDYAYHAYGCPALSCQNVCCEKGLCGYNGQADDAIHCLDDVVL